MDGLYWKILLQENGCFRVLWMVYTGKSYYSKMDDLGYYRWFIMENPITGKLVI